MGIGMMHVHCIVSSHYYGFTETVVMADHLAGTSLA